MRCQAISLSCTTVLPPWCLLLSLSCLMSSPSPPPIASKDRITCNRRQRADQQGALRMSTCRHSLAAVLIVLPRFLLRRQHACRDQAREILSRGTSSLTTTQSWWRKVESESPSAAPGIGPNIGLSNLRRRRQLEPAGKTAAAAAAAAVAAAAAAAAAGHLQTESSSGASSCSTARSSTS